MNVVDSAHRTVHAYPGGSESLGPRIGMSPAVLRNKVNPNSTSHHLTLAEADQIMGVTGDHRILQDLAGNHGYGLHRLDVQGAGDDVISQLLKTNAAKGEFAQQLQAALDDKVVTRNEYLTLLDSSAAVQASLVLPLRKLSKLSRQCHE
jgi:hypothetical protein